MLQSLFWFVVGVFVIVVGGYIVVAGYCYWRDVHREH